MPTKVPFAHRAVLAILLLWTCAATAAPPWVGRVIGVIDGDTPRSWGLPLPDWRMAEGFGPPSGEQIVREVANLRQLLEARMDGSDKVLAQIQALQEERFRGLDARMLAARSALAAGKEAAEKQQQQEYQGLVRQLEQLTSILTQANSNSNDRLQALKERLDRIEGASAGVGASWGVMLAVVTLALGIGGAVVGFTRRQRG